MAQSAKDHYFESVTSREAGMCHILNRMHPVLSLKIVYIFILRITHIHIVNLLHN